ncbi:hypothetical protein [Cognatishimia sp. MH4019]|uniref:hypothetical protein n=1 Tax=Cognatishimia sp. MH4019 TaxID=2854030 RepID=UPI001CD377EF|nr:hypothetical protein [Cognatishimia sp. MH4019]
MCTCTDLAETLATLELLETAGREQLLEFVAEDTGGYFNPIDPANTWASHLVEIKAHGVIGSGHDSTEAVRNWISAAKSQHNGLRQKQANDTAQMLGAEVET